MIQFYELFSLWLNLCPTAYNYLSDFPCEVGFAASVDYLVEPRDVMSFTNFLLKYIDQEEQFSGDIEPKFGGHQTLEERKQSFYAKNQTLHCGFVKGPPGYPSTGFDLYDKDKTYMNTCKVVVSSCIFGSSDFLRRPTSKQVILVFILLDYYYMPWDKYLLFLITILINCLRLFYFLFFVN